ncbi:hypothetical protein [Clostridium sp.]
MEALSPPSSLSGSCLALEDCFGGRITINNCYPAAEVYKEVNLLPKLLIL